MDEDNANENILTTTNAPLAPVQKQIITASDVTIKDPSTPTNIGDHPFLPPNLSKTKHKGPNLLKWVLLALIIAFILFVIIGYSVFNKSKTHFSQPTTHLPTNH